MEEDFIIFCGNNINKNVTELNFRNIIISDLSPLSELTNLKKLSLCCNNIVDLSHLALLSKLTTLELHRNNIVDLTPLKGLVNLTYLDLFYNKIVDLTPLKGLVNLTYLNLNDNNIHDVSPLSNLPNLEELHLNDNNIYDPTPIEGLINLTVLDLSDGNNITEIPLSFVNMRRMKHFFCNRYMITNLDNPIIYRWLHIRNDKSVYTNSENVHLTEIQTSLKESIIKLMANWKNIDVPYQEYFDITDTYQQLCTYKEIYQAVIIEIESLSEAYQKDARKRLNEEISEIYSKQPCFVGKITRIVNSLSGFSDKVNIRISKNEEISI